MSLRTPYLHVIANSQRTSEMQRRAEQVRLVKDARRDKPEGALIGLRHLF